MDATGTSANSKPRNQAAYDAGRWARKQADREAKRQFNQWKRDRRIRRNERIRRSEADRQSDSLGWTDNLILTTLYYSTCTAISLTATFIWQIDNVKAELCGAVPAWTRVMINLSRPGFCPSLRDEDPGWNLPFFNGRSLSLSDEQNRVIWTIIQVGQELGATENDLAIAISTCLVESQCKEIDYGDRDSIGAFQQRPSQGWPNTKDTATQTRAFFEGSTTNPGLFDIDIREENPGKAAQEVQRSAYPDRYRQRMREARRILEEFRSNSSLGGEFIPVQGSTKVNLGYGMRQLSALGEIAPRMHYGVDFNCSIGQPLIASIDGTIVRDSTTYPGFGPNGFYILDSQDRKHWYGHANRMIASDGQKVSAGEVIAECGTLGYSTGPHLHYELTVNGDRIDPTPFLKSIDSTFFD